MKIAGALRVKNEVRWIERCIRSIQPLCDSIHVLDDGSTDGTPELAASCGAIVRRSPFATTDEVRDKNLLLDCIYADGGADWIVAIDGDEVLSDVHHEMSALKTAIVSGLYDAVSLPILYLWDRPDQVRVDGVYGRFQRESLFRWRGERFQRTSAGGNFHCGNVPQKIRQNRKRVAHVNVPLLHYGYMERADRLRKYAWYNRLDPRNKTEDGYRHIVQGDVPEVPAAAKLLHAGPLELRSLDEISGASPLASGRAAI